MRADLDEVRAAIGREPERVAWTRPGLLAPDKGVAESVPALNRVWLQMQRVAYRQPYKISIPCVSFAPCLAQVNYLRYSCKMLLYNALTASTEVSVTWHTPCMSAGRDAEVHGPQGLKTGFRSIGF